MIQISCEACTALAYTEHNMFNPFACREMKGPNLPNSPELFRHGLYHVYFRGFDRSDR